MIACTGSATAGWDGACAGAAGGEEAGGSCTASGRDGGDARPVSGGVQTSPLLLRGELASTVMGLTAVSVVNIGAAGATAAAAAKAADDACLAGALPFFTGGATAASVDRGAAGERE